jgi:DNA (cytosine-5)-methyltransferase 1
MKPIRVFELFAGYGGASFGLKKANIPYECVGYSEVKKAAIKCYNQNFPNIKNYGDCTKIEPKDLPDFDLLTGGFPCQAFSLAGKREGFEDTRGTLFRDIIRIAEAKKPKYLILENVSGLTSHDNGLTFNIITRELKRIGYGVAYKILNSKDYGTPQSRERIWIVCKYGGWSFMEFQFPFKEELKISFQDLKDEEANYKKVKKTPSRDKMRIDCKNITNAEYIQTLTSKQDRYPNAGIIDYQDYYRFLTPKECFRCMGFFKDEINIEGLTTAEAYDLSGNGWDVNVVSKILKELYNGQGN